MSLSMTSSSLSSEKQKVAEILIRKICLTSQPTNICEFIYELGAGIIKLLKRVDCCTRIFIRFRLNYRSTSIKNVN